MDKTERLFALLDALRRRRAPVSAEALAQSQRVSVRTIYRDLHTLQSLGAPIEGEAGVGYVLRSGFFMPPLMFTPSELEALVLGARWVGAQPDGDLAAAANNALAKIGAASPEDLRARIEDTGLWPVSLGGSHTLPPVLERARKAMREERAVDVEYEDAEGRKSQRQIWPIQIAYFDGKQLIVAWCCLRNGFRNFRSDRIQRFELTTTPFGRPRRSMSAEWWIAWQAEREAAAARGTAEGRGFG